MNSLHWGMRNLVDLLLWPFSAFSPKVQLVGCSLIVGLLFLWIYGKLVQQSKIRAVKKAVYSALLETILFRHEPRLCLQAQGRMAVGGLKYFLLALPPVLMLAVPFILLSAELQLRFGYRALALQEQVVLRAVMQNADLLQEVELETDSVLSLAGPVRSPAAREIYWRLQSPSPGIHKAALKVGANRFPLQIAVESRPARIEPYAYAAFWPQLLYFSNTSSQPAFSKALAALELYYPPAEYSFLGWRVEWLLAFVLLSIIAGIVGSYFLGIEV